MFTSSAETESWLEQSDIINFHVDKITIPRSLIFELFIWSRRIAGKRVTQYDSVPDPLRVLIIYTHEKSIGH